MKEEIRDMIADMLEIEHDELGYDDLFTDKGMDSFIAMQLIATLENEFDISVPDERLDEFTDVNATVRIVEELKK